MHTTVRQPRRLAGRAGILVAVALLALDPLAMHGATAAVTISAQAPGRPASPTVTQVSLIAAGLAEPSGVAADAAGDAFVVDRASGKVVELTAAGVQRTIVAGLTGPYGMAVDGAGNVYVADTGANRVVELPAGGTLTTLGFSGLAQPRAVAVDDSGAVYVADDGNSRIVKLAGGTQMTLGFTGITAPTGVAVDAAGDVFVADPGSGHLVELPAAGVQTSLAFSGTPSDVATDGAGNLFVVDGGANRVVELPKVGAPTTLAFTGLSGPRAVAVTPSGTVYVADTGNHRVVRLPNAGSPSVVGFVRLTDPRGVAVDGAGNAFVADGTLRVVLERSAAGDITTRPFTGLVQPRGVAVDATGNLFVADGADHVIELTKAGTQVTLPFAHLDHPNGVAVDGAGDVFVSNPFANTVVELAKDGTQSTLPFSGLNLPGGVAVDAAGDVFVANGGTNKVLELTKAGTQISLPTSGLIAPLGLAVDAVGDVFVTDYSSHVIELPAGAAQTSLPFTGLSNVGGVAADATGNVYVTSVGATGALVELAVADVAPAAPTIGAVSGGHGSASVSWTVPVGNGGPLPSGYVVTPYLGAVAQDPTHFDATTTTRTVTGLVNGSAYRFTVAAENSVGTGPASARSAVVVPPFATLPDFVDRQSQDIQGRAATTAERDAEVTALEGGAAPTGYVAGLRRGTDATTKVDPTARLYFAYFLRIPDASGLRYWIAKTRAGTPLHAASDAFAGSGEFKRRYGSLSNSAFVLLVYTNVLGRPGEAGGIAFWTKQLDQHKKTRGQVMIGFSESNEYKTKKQPSVDVAVTWIDLLGVSPGQSAFAAWVTNLTTGGKGIADLAATLFATPAYATRIG